MKFYFKADYIFSCILLKGFLYNTNKVLTHRFILYNKKLKKYINIEFYNIWLWI